MLIITLLCREGLDWTDLFDVVIVGANKPAFLTNGALNLFRVDRDRDGELYNFEDKEVAFRSLRDAQEQQNLHHNQQQHLAGGQGQGQQKSETQTPSRSCKLFHGGCWRDLHRMLGVTYGDKILYVADQMFSDILR